METKVKIWWTSEELTKFIPDFAERVTAYTATLPVKPKAVKPVDALKAQVAELEAQAQPPVKSDEPAKTRRRARKA